MLYTFSLPTKADKVPAGPDWLHEVNYDGYRMMLIREHGRLTVRSAVALTGESRNTIKDHLRRLKNASRVKQLGTGRGTWYEPG